MLLNSIVKQRNQDFRSMQPPLPETIRFQRFGLAMAACGFVVLVIRDVVLGASVPELLRSSGLAVLFGSMAYSVWTRR